MFDSLSVPQATDSLYLHVPFQLIGCKTELLYFARGIPLCLDLFVVARQYMMINEHILCLRECLPRS